VLFEIKKGRTPFPFLIQGVSKMILNRGFNFTLLQGYLNRGIVTEKAPAEAGGVLQIFWIPSLGVIFSRKVSIRDLVKKLRHFSSYLLDDVYRNISRDIKLKLIPITHVVSINGKDSH
jgi:hypothetical protein